MKKIAILGSTGSIGKQSLDVVRANRERFSVSCLAVASNVALLEQQMQEFSPETVVIADKVAGEQFRAQYTGTCKILVGEAYLEEIVTEPNVDVVLTSVVGFTGLKPTVAAIKAGKTIALANKETLVAAGELVTKLAKKHKVAILPVDSEHSAILQSLQGQSEKSIKRIILTASGGPFRTKTAAELEKVTIADCLKHPNWSMGRKITVDSASLANKGLEVIEARWLFDQDYDKIDVIVHPQSIVHSMVEYIDGAVIAQLGIPDMKLPIQYALTYPERISADFGRLDFLKYSNLTFEEPNLKLFPCLALAYQAGKADGVMPCAFNAANEVAVEYFLAGALAFVDIPRVIEAVLAKQDNIDTYSLEEIIEVDASSRKLAKEYIKKI